MEFTLGFRVILRLKRMVDIESQLFSDLCQTGLSRDRAMAWKDRQCSANKNKKKCVRRLLGALWVDIKNDNNNMMI
jgi:hypothetical protein